MATTKFLISRAVGFGDHNDDVKRLQFLLRAAAIRQGATGNKTLLQAVPGIEKADWPDGRWGRKDKPSANSSTTKALQAFRKIVGIQPPAPTDQVAPNDTTILRLAEEANILIKLSLRDGIKGLQDFNELVKDATYEYARMTDACSFWPLQGMADRIVQLKNVTADVPRIIQPGPVYLNCTTYVNLAFTIYMHGNVTDAQYNASVGDIGDSGPHIAARYGFAIMVRKEAKDVASGAVFHTADEISSHTKLDRLYGIEIARAKQWNKKTVQWEYGNVQHEAVLYNSTVYHSWNYPSTQPTLQPQTTDEFVTLMKTTYGQSCYFYVLQEPRAGDSIHDSRIEVAEVPTGA